MNLILLPGNSVRNREWIDEVERVFSPHFENVYTQYYDHWFIGDGDRVLDLEAELDKVISQTEDFGKYIILAKSAGALVALKGIYDGVLSPEACVFIGLPKGWADEQGFALDEWLLSYSTTTLFIQQRQDPAMFSENLQQYLEDLQVTHHEISVVPGASHSYNDIDDLYVRVSAFIDFE